MGVGEDKTSKGQRAFHAGQAAEQIVERDYLRRGYCVSHRRWRGGGGEIDLILHKGDVVVCVEVKKSRDFGQAAQALRPAQIQRIFAAASVFLGGEPAGQLTEMRLDVALVDATGAIEILKNVFPEC